MCMFLSKSRVVSILVLSHAGQLAIFAAFLLVAAANQIAFAANEMRAFARVNPFIEICAMVFAFIPVKNRFGKRKQVPLLIAKKHRRRFVFAVTHVKPP